MGMNQPDEVRANASHQIVIRNTQRNDSLDATIDVLRQSIADHPGTSEHQAYCPSSITDPKDSRLHVLHETFDTEWVVTIGEANGATEQIDPPKTYGESLLKKVITALDGDPLIEVSIKRISDNIARVSSEAELLDLPAEVASLPTPPPSANPLRNPTESDFLAGHDITAFRAHRKKLKAKDEDI